MKILPLNYNNYSNLSSSNIRTERNGNKSVAKPYADNVFTYRGEGYRGIVSVYASNLLAAGVFQNGKAPVSFEGAGKFITYKNAFRSYAKNGHIGCIYCGKKMFVQDEIDKFLYIAPRISKNAKVFTRVMSHFTDYFNKNQKFILKKIDLAAEKMPGASLRAVIHSLVPAAEKRIVERQMIVFKHMSILSSSLPKEKMNAINKLINQFKCRIRGIPYVDDYSGKEFFYQIAKLTESISDKSVAKKIYENARFLECSAFKKKSGCLQKEAISKVYNLTNFNPRMKNFMLEPNDPNGIKKAQKMILLKIKNYANNVNRKDIIDLCDITERKIDGLPVVLKFSNKAFSFKVHEILQGEDEKLVKIFEKLMCKFPTSSHNVNAFIVKYKNLSDNRLIYDFLDLSKVSIEHIKPTSNKGVDNIGNWALACRYCNGIHGSNNIYGENFPFNRKAGQKYFNKIIFDTNNFGYFKPKHVIVQAKNYRKQTGIKIDISKLKYVPEK